MFWLRNKRINFQLHTLILVPEILAGLHSSAGYVETDTIINQEDRFARNKNCIRKSNYLSLLPIQAGLLENITDKRIP